MVNRWLVDWLKSKKIAEFICKKELSAKFSEILSFREQFSNTSWIYALDKMWASLTYGEKLLLEPDRPIFKFAIASDDTIKKITLECNATRVL